MDEIKYKQTIAKNIVRYRKNLKLTQAEFAEKMGYSDKAISKWERAESLPEVIILQKIASFFEITLEELVTDTTDKVKVWHFRIKKIIIIPILSSLIAWLVATLIFVFFNWFNVPFLEKNYWLFFIYALPITFIILVVFSAKWWNRLLNTIMVTFLIWTLAASLHLSLIFVPFLKDMMDISLIYFIGIPLQIMLVLWYLYRESRKRK